MLPMIKPRSSINLYQGNEVDLATFDYHTSCILVTYQKDTNSGRGERKRKSEDKDKEWTVKRPKAKQTRFHICILHNTYLVDVGTFVPLQEFKGGAYKALEKFQNVEAKRLKEDINSAYRIKEVSDLIPSSVDGLDLELKGWNGKCNY